MSDYLSRLVMRTMLAPEIRPRLQPLFGSGNGKEGGEIAEETEAGQTGVPRFRAPAAEGTAGEAPAEHAAAGARAAPAGRTDGFAARVKAMGTEPLVEEDGVAAEAAEAVESAPAAPSRARPEMRWSARPLAGKPEPAGPGAGPQGWMNWQPVAAEARPERQRPPAEGEFVGAADATAPRQREIPGTFAAANISVASAGSPAEVGVGRAAGALTEQSAPMAERVRTEGRPAAAEAPPGAVRPMGRGVHAAATARVSRDGPAAARQADRRTAASPVDERAAGGDGAPDIQVTIGRLEIRAAMTPGPSVRPPTPKGPSSLEEYLRSRVQAPRP